MVERDGFASVTTTNVYHSPCNFRLIDLLFYQYFLDVQIILVSFPASFFILKGCRASGSSSTRVRVIVFPFIYIDSWIDACYYQHRGCHIALVVDTAGSFGSSEHFHESGLKFSCLSSYINYRKHYREVSFFYQFWANFRWKLANFHRSRWKLANSLYFLIVVIIRIRILVQKWTRFIAPTSIIWKWRKYVNWSVWRVTVES
jgi:hypothetical protein